MTGAQNEVWNGLSAALDELVSEVQTRSTRMILGVVGPPGAGKSTLAEQIVVEVGTSVPCKVAPMDGFHRSNEELERLGLAELKGVPKSFDAEGFLAALRQVRAAPPVDVPWPTYDRNRECVVPDGMAISSRDRLVVVEGNYLLLRTPPWDGVHPMLDKVWFLDVPVAILEPRLLKRQSRDRSPADAARKVASTDLPNAVLVATTKPLADVILTQRT